jgi:membrane protease YdiL (CAAX protease family)
MPAEAGAVASRPSASRAVLRSYGLLIAWAGALATGEWLALRASAGLWSIQAVRDSHPGGLPFYGSLVVELAILSRLFPRQTRTPWLPVCWSSLGLVGLVGALTCNALGLASLRILRGGSFPAWHAPGSWLMFLSGGILCPVVEEWIFRGVLWRLASDAVGQFHATVRVLVAIGFTALLFGAWHLPFAGQAFLGYNLAFAAFLGLARWRFGAVAPGAVVHALGNSFYLLTS